MSKGIAEGSFDNYKKIIIEIGSGDGRLLKNLANLYDKDSVFLIGIEIDPAQYIDSCNGIKEGSGGEGGEGGGERKQKQEHTVYQ